MTAVKFLFTIIFFPLIAGILRFKDLSRGMKWLFYFVAWGSITETTVMVDKSVLTIFPNSMPIGHLYIALSLFFAGMFYLHALKGFVNSKTIWIILIIFEIFALVNVIFIQSPENYPSVSGSVSALILVVFSVLLFAKIMIEGKIKNLIQEPVVWINSAILLYYTSSFFYHILFNILIDKSYEFLSLASDFYKLFNVIFYTLIGIGFLKAKPSKKLN